MECVIYLMVAVGAACIHYRKGSVSGFSVWYKVTSSVVAGLLFPVSIGVIIAKGV